MKRNFLKRCNRGLLLGGVLLLALIIYAVWDTAVFQRELPAIEQTVREYVERSPQMAILPPPYNKVGMSAGSEVIAEKMAENEALLREYWTFSKEDAEGGAALLRQVESVVEYNARGRGAITSAKGIVQYIHQIRQIGRNRAEVSFSYTGSIRYVDSVRWVLFSAGLQETASSDSFEGKIVPTGDVTVLLKKQDGRWKIDSIQTSAVSWN